MMILALRTDTGRAELYLHDGHGKIAEFCWQADRTLARDLLKQCQALLDRNNIGWSDLSGLVVFKGPGSFTGLRIGITTVNTIAYSENIPIVGASGDDWLIDGVRRHSLDENDNIVLPFYGAEPRITQSKK